MRWWKDTKWMPLLMGLTILAIAGFQVYWLRKSYEREERTLEMRTNMLFRETMRSLQTAKLKLDRLTVSPDSLPSRIIVQRELTTERRLRELPPEKMEAMLETIMRKTDGGRRTKVFLRTAPSDSFQLRHQAISPRQNRILQFLYDVDSLQDSIKVREVEAAYAKRLDEQGLEVPFSISRVPTVDSADRRVYNEVTLGFARPITYRLDLGDSFPFLLKRISSSILFSVFLVGFTVLSFWLLYRNLLRQKKLADIKNEFISNITHELKTPIATVSVAIEALRSFSASMDPQKTRQYLDISANELQRLSLLVDKVLKLSMFEKRAVELKYEPLNLQQLVAEVTASMRLQFEKHKAQVRVTADGTGSLTGDRLHLVSVLFNLLDNALKYATERPVINIAISETADQVQLVVADNGIGIPAEYQGRIFEKFFRVPHGNVHNAKGYGLGLSYVAHVVAQHQGSIQVENNEGGGTRFRIRLPKRLREAALAA